MRALSCCFLIATFALLTVPQAAAQHGDLLIASDGAPAPTLVVGAFDFDAGEAFAGVRLFEGELLLETDLFSGHDLFRGDEPGLNAVAQPAQPAGYTALPGGLDLFLDVAPQTLGSVVSNLLRWNGATLEAVTDGTTLDVFGAVADGGPAMVAAPAAWATSSPVGFVHQHRPLTLLDADANPSTTAPAGVYVVGLTARAAGFAPSAPFYLVLATAGVDEEDHELAAEFVATTFGVSGLEPAVPEPASALLAICGALGNARRVRRRA